MTSDCRVNIAKISADNVDQKCSVSFPLKKNKNFFLQVQIPAGCFSDVAEVTPADVDLSHLPTSEEGRIAYLLSDDDVTNTSSRGLDVTSDGLAAVLGNEGSLLGKYSVVEFQHNYSMYLGNPVKVRKLKYFVRLIEGN